MNTPSRSAADSSRPAPLASRRQPTVPSPCYVRRRARLERLVYTARASAEIFSEVPPAAFYKRLRSSARPAPYNDPSTLRIPLSWGKAMEATNRRMLLRKRIPSPTEASCVARGTYSEQREGLDHSGRPHHRRTLRTLRYWVTPIVAAGLQNPERRPPSRCIRCSGTATRNAGDRAAARPHGGRHPHAG
ncbi:hypothetical protein C8J57DRAFT_224574 [Mycena rebaudengoi]|nr:hypothetical protein C8J57DRAFT_224574 [Mycena rebaudengoi]